MSENTPSARVKNPSLAAPVARREPTPTHLHGQTLEDDYAWLRNKMQPEVTEYLTAENAYTGAAMAGTTELQTTLYTEMLSHIQETDESVPYPDYGYLYFSRTVEGSQYPIYCRRLAADGSPEEVLLDVNRLAEGQAYMAVGAMSVSPSGNLLAYSTDQHRLPPVQRCICAICAAGRTCPIPRNGSARSRGRLIRRPCSSRRKTSRPSAMTNSSGTRWGRTAFSPRRTGT